jgi:hypothetical protein
LGDLSESPFIDFTLDPPQPVGAYRVEIYANGNLDHVASFRGAFPLGQTWHLANPCTARKGECKFAATTSQVALRRLDLNRRRSVLRLCCSELIRPAKLATGFEPTQVGFAPLLRRIDSPGKTCPQTKVHSRSA